MALATCKTKFVQVNPRKARLVLAKLRGKPVVKAMIELAHSPEKASRLLIKTVQSAVANAENNAGANREDLFIKEIKVDGGPYRKAFGQEVKGVDLRLSVRQVISQWHLIKLQTRRKESRYGTKGQSNRI